MSDLCASCPHQWHGLACTVPITIHGDLCQCIGAWAEADDSEFDGPPWVAA